MLGVERLRKGNLSTWHNTMLARSSTEDRQMNARPQSDVYLDYRNSKSQKMLESWDAGTPFGILYFTPKKLEENDF